MTSAKKTLHADDQSIFTVSDLLSEEECDHFIRFTEAHGYDPAPITTGAGFRMRPDIRNNWRVMIDDTTRADWLWERLAPFMPERWGLWRPAGLNERFRYYRYDTSQFFKWHGDGAFIRSDVERSLFTAMVYLNGDFEGGTTDFWDGGSIVPRRGMALLFEHSQTHQGAPVRKGRKYVLRTDVMYRRQ